MTTNTANGTENKVRVYWFNFDYESAERFDTVEAAAAYAKSKGFEASFWRGDEHVGSWTVFGGFRMGA